MSSVRHPPYFEGNRPLLTPTRRHRNRCVLAAFPPVFAKLRLSKPWRAHHKEPTASPSWNRRDFSRTYAKGCGYIHGTKSTKHGYLGNINRQAQPRIRNETCFLGSLPQHNFSHLHRSLPFSVQGQNGPLRSGLLSDSEQENIQMQIRDSNASGSKGRKEIDVNETESNGVGE